MLRSTQFDVLQGAHADNACCRPDHIERLGGCRRLAPPPNGRVKDLVLDRLRLRARRFDLSFDFLVVVQQA